MNSVGKNQLIASAVSAALASGAAFALPPSATPTAVYYAGGGSAQSNAFYVAACKLIGSNADVYSDAGVGVLSGDYVVIYGNPTAAGIAAGLPSGGNIMYMYKFNGGSYTNGIAPQTSSPAPTTLTYPTVASVLAVTAGTGGGTSCAAGGAPTYAYTNALTNVQPPDFGLADIEVPVFTGLNNPTGNAGGSAQNTNGGPAPTVGNGDAIYDNLFGVAITDNLYSAAAHPKTNFTRAEVEGILEGTVSDWSQLYADDGTQLAAGGIIFLDRGEGSGTKASGNQYFLGYPGDGTSAHTPFSAGNAYSGTTLTGADPGFTEQSLDIAESSTGNLVKDLVLAQSKGIRAIAILGMENPPAKNLTSGGARAYDFTKIDGNGVDTGAAGDNINQIGTGAATSYINAVKGSYDFFYQNSFNTRATLAGQNLANANAFKAQMTAPSFVGVNSGQAFPLSLPGTLQDGDKNALAKGVTIATRKEVSTGPLFPILPAVPTGIPVGSDPL